MGGRWASDKFKFGSEFVSDDKFKFGSLKLLLLKINAKFGGLNSMLSIDQMFSNDY